MTAGLGLDGPVPPVLARDPGSSWRDDAACLSAPPDLFDPLTPGEDRYAPRVKAALVFCVGCPVRAQCLADAATNGAAGVRGGRVFLDRDAAAVSRLVTELMPRPHGTPAALRDHRAGGRSCRACEWHLAGRPRIGRARVLAPHFPYGWRPL